MSGIKVDRGQRVAAASVAERLARLFAAHHLGLYALARRLLDGAAEAEDMVQETFLRAARRPRSLPASEQGAEAWLVRVLINLCRDRFRRAGVRRRGQDLEVTAQAQRRVDVDPESASVTRDLVERALAAVEPRRRAILILHELDDIPVRDIATLLGVTQVTVRWHLSKARREVLRRLEPGGGSAAGGGQRGGRS